ncbi:MAG TPA: hypothetical protein VLS88_20760, partial [Polyangiales bacterium]|nr:hypothetical protein [Polyangiales bacterium]
TCVDTLLSTIGQTRAAVRTGVFQLLFNVFNVLLLVGFAEELAAIAQSLGRRANRSWLLPCRLALRTSATPHVAFL